MKYSVIIPIVHGTQVNDIILGFFKLGYAVAPISDTSYLMTSSPVITLCVKLETSDDVSKEMLTDNIKTFLNKNGIAYYNITVIGHPCSGIVCNSGNIAPSKPRKVVPYLKLVRSPKTPPPLPPPSSPKELA